TPPAFRAAAIAACAMVCLATTPPAPAQVPGPAPQPPEPALQIDEAPPADDAQLIQDAPPVDGEMDAAPDPIDEAEADDEPPFEDYEGSDDTELDVEDEQPAEDALQRANGGLLLNFRNASINVILDELSAEAGFIIVREVEPQGRVNLTSR